MKLSLGAFIAQLRKEKGLTQKQLSEILGVSDKTISHWEREESAPDISILPILASTLGVTVDELLKGEVNPPINTVPQFTPKSVIDKTPSGYRMFKIANVISAALSLFSTIFSSAAVYFIRYITLDSTACYISFFATLGAVFISAVLTIIFNLIFTTKLDVESDSHNRYRFKAYRISTLNIYLGLVCLSANLVFTGIYEFIFVAIALVLCLIIEYMLKSTSILSLDKAFESEKKKCIYLLRKSCLVLCAVLVILGSCGHFFISEFWAPSTTDKIFDTAQEFKEYMETPKEKPEDAWKTDTTAPPTTTSVPTQQQSPVVTIIPNQSSNTDRTETIYDANGNEVVTFIFRNKAVYEYSYGNDGKFYVTTYDSMTKAKNINHFRNYTVDFLMPLYYIVCIAIALIIYKKKLKNI